jgi:hypothetical protein
MKVKVKTIENALVALINSDALLRKLKCVKLGLFIG